jgi:hypothetical protein
MFAPFLKKLPIAIQVRLSQWMTSLLTDTYDVLRYDSEIHTLLGEMKIDYQTCVPVSWFDYCDPDIQTWSVFISQAGRWQLVSLPNPLYLHNHADEDVTLHEVTVISEVEPEERTVGRSPLHA